AAALCLDAATAAGARRWNDANVLAISLRATSDAELGEILDAWFGAEPSRETADLANVEYLAGIEPGAGGEPCHGTGARPALRRLRRRRGRRRPACASGPAARCRTSR